MLLTLVPRGEGIARYRRRTGSFMRPERIVVERPVAARVDDAAVLYVTAGVVRGVLIEDAIDVALAAY